jgi:hypothetical protein
MRFLAFFLPTAPSVFFHRSCDKTSAVCWLGGRTSQMCRNRCVKCPHFAEKPAGHGKHVEKILWHHKCPKIMWQNVRTSLKSRLDVANVLGKILWQNVHMSPNSWQDVTNGSKNFVTNRPNFASGKDGHDVTKHFGRVDVMSQVTNCPPWSGGGRKIPRRIVQV